MRVGNRSEIPDTSAMIVRPHAASAVRHTVTSTGGSVISLPRMAVKPQARITRCSCTMSFRLAPCEVLCGVDCRDMGAIPPMRGDALQPREVSTRSVIPERPAWLALVHLLAPRIETRLHHLQHLGLFRREVVALADISTEVVEPFALCALEPFPVADAGRLVATSLPEHLLARRFHLPAQHRH